MHVQEQQEMVTYLGRAIPKAGFRAYIYSNDGKEKLVENWEEFDLYTHTDTWFATKEEALQKPNKKKHQKPYSKNLVVKDELIEDDFLPNETGE